MPWIHVIDEKDATGNLKKTYDYIREKRGKISNIMRVHSLNPRAMQKHMELYLVLMFESSGLSREERELLGVVVSRINKCDYCVEHHSVALNHYWKDEKKMDKLKSDFEAVGLPSRQVQMLRYARKLTRAPSEITEEDITALRERGFQEYEILNINLIISYFCLVNRIVLGLGVGFTESEIDGYKY